MQAEAAKAEAAKAEAAQAEAAKAEAVKAEAAKAEAAKAEAAQAEAAKAEAAKAETAKAEAAQAEAAKAEAAKVAAIPWSPTSALDQVKAIQGLLRDLKYYRGPLDGDPGPATRAAIRDYQRANGDKETGEPSKALFDSLKEKRALSVSSTPG